MNKEIRAICENEEVALSQLGAFTSEKLKDRLADIIAASGIVDLPFGNARIMNTADNSSCTIDLCDQYVLLFIPNHVKMPMSKENVIDWSRVKNIKITAIQKK